MRKKNRPRSFVVGASGQVGTQMLGVLGEHALATSRVARPETSPAWLQMDLAETADAAQAGKLLDQHELDAIYCVGGMTYVDGCETQPELAWRTNARGPGVLAEYARQRGVPYLFFSTDYVFDGAGHDAGPYGEDARTHPLSVYGQTKLEGEQRVLQAYPEAVVLRTTWVYGADPRQKNYVYSLMAGLAKGERMRTPMDQISTPTYNRDLIEAALGLVAAGARGVFHAGGPELMSRLEFAQRLAEWLGLDADLLQGVTTAELGQAAARPLASGLRSEKIRSMYPKLKLRTVAETLDDCGAELRAYLQRL